MTIELPDLSPFDALDEDAADKLRASEMLGHFGELDGDGYPFWKSNPETLGAGLIALVRIIRPLAAQTPKMEGEDFLRRLALLGVETAELELAPPDQFRQEPSISDSDDEGAA